MASPVATVDAPDAPDATWNVTRLRAAARARGIANYSRKSKDQLITELSD